MKRSMFRLLAVSLLTMALTCFANAAMAQGRGNGNGNGNGNNGGGEDPPPPTLPFEYRVEYASGGNPLPENLDSLWVNNLIRISTGTNKDGIYVVGRYSLLGSDVRRGFICIRYDNDGGSEFIDMTTRVGLDDSEFIEVGCNDINQNGIVVGGIRDSNGLVHAVYFDLFESESPRLHSLNDEFPNDIPAPTEKIISARCVNARGDIFPDFDNSFNISLVVNPFTMTTYPIPVDSSVTAYDINDFGTVLARGPGGLFRYNIFDPDPSGLEYFPEFGTNGEPQINNLDEFCARVDVPLFRKNGKVYDRVRHAVRYSSQVDWISDIDGDQALLANGINLAGDICGETYRDWDNAYFHYSIKEIAEDESIIETGPTVILKTVTTDNYFVTGSLYQLRLTERVALSPTVSAPIICGTIRNRDDADERRLFFLIPQLQ